MATAAGRSIARLPRHPRPVLPRLHPLPRARPVFTPLPRSSTQQRWASSSPLQKLKRPQEMGSSDLFIVLTLLLGVGYVGGSVFGVSGEKKRKDAAAASEAQASVDEKRTEAPPIVAQKLTEAEETVAPPPPPPPSPAPSSSDEASSSGDALGPDETDDPSQAAFNPETGEINWDCPCLGGMAHGPCGEAFKAAFSCFVYSEQEPKGSECIESFKAMQECFRAHPDVYGEDDVEEEDEVEKDDFVVVDRPESGPSTAAPTPADAPNESTPPASAKESE